MLDIEKEMGWLLCRGFTGGGVESSRLMTASLEDLWIGGDIGESTVTGDDDGDFSEKLSEDIITIVSVYRGVNS